MSIEKKSLINNMTATKKALIANNKTSSPVATSKTSVGLEQIRVKVKKTGVGLSKFGLSKHLSKTGASLSKHFSKK